MNKETEKTEKYNLSDLVKDLVFKAGKSSDSKQALEWSQAALNMINTLDTLATFYEKLEAEKQKIKKGGGIWGI